MLCMYCSGFNVQTLKEGLLHALHLLIMIGRLKTQSRAAAYLVHAL